MMTLVRLFTYFWLALLLAALPCAAKPNVAVTIKPVHSLVSAVMKDVGTPFLLVKGAQSPHDFSLKPSDARALAGADIVFWLGPGLEAFLEKPLQTLAGKAVAVDLSAVPGIVRLGVRHDDDFGAHHHDHAAETHETSDPHMWLDPHNAKTMVRAITNALSKADAANAGVYERNARRLIDALDALTSEVGAALAPVTGRPFVVFHDAYQYFEKRFGLTAAGSITVGPDIRPGAGRLKALQQAIRAKGVICAFAEPQFDAKLVETLATGANVRTAVLDPLGAAIEDGPGLYFSLIRGMAETVKGCLSPAE